MYKKIMAKRLISVSVVFTIWLFSTSVYAKNQLYRYKNDEGNVVLNHVVPPRYAQKGYDILNGSGKLIKTVPPAPTKDELSRSQTLKQFDSLYRRFRSVEEIDFAKRRVVNDIDSSISIVKRNIESIESELFNQKKRAASIERQGREVPKLLLSQILSTQKELVVTQDLLTSRNEGKVEQVKMYDDYISLFKNGMKLKLEQHQLKSGAIGTSR